MSEFSEEINKLNVRLNRLDSAFERHFFNLGNKRYIDIYAFQEGLISALWQTWCSYCKSIFFGSIKGAITLNGAVIDTPPYVNSTEYELFYLAKMWGESKTINQVKSAQPQSEPTWGDVSKLSVIFNNASTPNAAIVSPPLANSQLLKDLQVVRNASAHINAHCLQKINLARVRYSQTSYKHPSDVLLWVDPLNNDYLWKAWIIEIRILSTAIAQ